MYNRLQCHIAFQELAISNVTHPISRHTTRSHLLLFDTFIAPSLVRDVTQDCGIPSRIAVVHAIQFGTPYLNYV